MHVFFLILCMVAGVAVAVQSALNARLGTVVGLSSFAALMSFVTGLVPILLYFAIESHGFQMSNYDFSQLKFHYFLGGVLGAAYVMIIILSVPKLGAATVLAVTIASQVVLGAVMDHFGWLYLQQRTFSLGRMFGVVSIVTGAVLIAVF